MRQQEEPLPTGKDREEQVQQGLLLRHIPITGGNQRDETKSQTYALLKASETTITELA